MAYDFSSSGRIEYTLASGQKGNNVISFAFWLIRTGSGGNNFGQAFFLANSEPQGNRKFYFENDGPGATNLVFFAEFSSNRGGWQFAVPDTNWHHWAITYDATSTSNTPTVYKDGSTVSVSLKSAPSGTINTNNDNILTLGNAPGGSTDIHWDGQIADFAHYNRILTAGEVSMLAKAYSPLFVPKNLIFYTPLLQQSELMFNASSALTNATKFTHPKIIYPTPAMLINNPATAAVSVENYLTLLGVG